MRRRVSISYGSTNANLSFDKVATVNCPLDQPDPAVIRPGRLIGYREFRRLTPGEARRLATAKGLSLVDGPDHLLAEVYSNSAPGLTAPASHHFGFGK